MKFIYNDGGRAAAGFKGTADDCVCRAIAIATERPYKEVYDLINEYGKKERMGKHQSHRSSARTGVYIKTERKILEDLGWEWVPTMLVGQGCKVHLTEKELPKGRLIVSVSRHATCVIDGVLHDTYDCSRDGNRCVYGYYRKKPEPPKETGMTVLEVVKKYGLEDFTKHYDDVYGCRCNLLNLDDLKTRRVKAIRINFPTKEATITILPR